MVFLCGQRDANRHRERECNSAWQADVASGATPARVRRPPQGRSTNSSADSVATESSVDRNTADATVDWQAP